VKTRAKLGLRPVSDFHTLGSTRTQDDMTGIKKPSIINHLTPLLPITP